MDKADTKQMRSLLLAVLRHDPDLIGVHLDPEGFVDAEDFLHCANLCQPLEYTEECLWDVLRASEGTTFGIEGESFRALSGHTTEMVEYPTSEPPEYLYYLIKKRDRRHVEEHGLAPAHERWVPLETSGEGAEATAGKRRIKKPLLVILRAREAWENGISFYTFCNRWYAQEVPPCRIELFPLKGF